MTRSQHIFSHLKSDLPASMVVFFVALPLCLGIALASGAPLFSGLIAGIVGGVIVGSLSGSKIGVSGPAAGLAAVVLAAIGTLGGYENFLLAVVLGGIIQLAFGILKAGIIGYYFPSGGRTKLSAIILGFLLLISVMLIPGLLNMIPLSVLAAVLLIVGYKLAKPGLFKKMYDLGWKQFIPFTMTVLGIVKNPPSYIEFFKIGPKSA